MFDAFNVYRADLALLVDPTPQYTQDPLLPLAAQFRGEPNPFKLDGFLPPLGQGVFYLVTGVVGGVESSLGFDSFSIERANDWACP